METGSHATIIVPIPLRQKTRRLFHSWHQTGSYVLTGRL